MDLHRFIEQFNQMPPIAQIAWIGFVLAIIILIVTVPTAGTSIITFLIGVKMLLTRSPTH